MLPWRSHTRIRARFHSSSRALSRAPVYTTFIRVYVNSGRGAHVLLLSLPTNLFHSLSLLFLLRGLTSPFFSHSRSHSHSRSARPWKSDRTGRFSETGGVKDRGAMGMARYAARCPSRVTRRVGYLLCLSILLGGKQKIRRISISSRALALITRKSIPWAGISTRRGGEGSSSGRLLTQCTSFPRSPFLLSLPPIATVYGPGRGTVRSPSPYAKRELFIRGRWQFLFFPPFLFLLVFSFFWTLTRAYIVVTPLRIFAPIYHN